MPGLDTEAVTRAKNAKNSPAVLRYDDMSAVVDLKKSLENQIGIDLRVTTSVYVSHSDADR
jgi:hypothetical protein